MPKKKGDDQFLVPLEELLEAGCHFGHQARRWHPKMASYIWDQRAGVHIFDLSLTQKKLQQACVYVKELVAQGKTIVFVGTKRQAASIIKEEATDVGIPYVSNRWLGGTITNWQQVKKSIQRLRDLKQKRESGELDHYTKKERVLFDRDIARLTRFVGGVESLDAIPDTLYIVDIRREEAAVREARRAGIPVVAIVDSNCDPNLVDIVIPANDDAVRSIRLITSKIAEAVKEGQKMKKQNKVEDK